MVTAKTKRYPGRLLIAHAVIGARLGEGGMTNLTWGKYALFLFLCQERQQRVSSSLGQIFYLAHRTAFSSPSYDHQGIGAPTESMK